MPWKAGCGRRKVADPVFFLFSICSTICVCVFHFSLVGFKGNRFHYWMVLCFPGGEKRMFWRIQGVREPTSKRPTSFPYHKLASLGSWRVQVKRIDLLTLWFLLVWAIPRGQPIISACVLCAREFQISKLQPGSES